MPATPLPSIAAAVERNVKVLQRRPDMGLADDSPARVTWQGGLRMQATHASGKTVLTDMPAELGGSADQVTPGWLFRAGLASCGATCIVLAAACEGIELTKLDVQVRGRSDSRGIFGMLDGDGVPVYGGPVDMRLTVRIGARGIDPARLRALAHDAFKRSMVSNACERATPLDLQIDIDEA